MFFQAENGVIGLGSRPPEGMEDPDLTDAGGGFVTAMPGAASIDSAISFGLIRGGHLDMTVLGGLEVDERGYLGGCTVPGMMVPGMGGAMDLVSGARKVVVAMVHTGKGGHKIVPSLHPAPDRDPAREPRRHRNGGDRANRLGLVLRERGPGVSIHDIENATGADLIVEGDPPEMRLKPIGGPPFSARGEGAGMRDRPSWGGCPASCSSWPGLPLPPTWFAGGHRERVPLNVPAAGLSSRAPVDGRDKPGHDVCGSTSGRPAPKTKTGTLFPFSETGAILRLFQRSAARSGGKGKRTWMWTRNPSPRGPGGTPTPRR